MFDLTLINSDIITDLNARDGVHEFVSASDFGTVPP